MILIFFLKSINFNEKLSFENLNRSAPKYKKLNVEHALVYFILQYSRNPINLIYCYCMFLRSNNNKFNLNNFKSFYNKYYLDLFKNKYISLFKNKDQIHITPFYIKDNKNDNPVFLSEFNTLNLIDFKNNSPFLKDYCDEILKNIYVTVISDNKIFFCTILPKMNRFQRIFKYISNLFKDYPTNLFKIPKNDDIYNCIYDDVIKNWNFFL